jgi:hypothetical protein
MKRTMILSALSLLCFASSAQANVSFFYSTSQPIYYHAAPRPVFYHPPRFYAHPQAAFSYVSFNQPLYYGRPMMRVDDRRHGHAYGHRRNHNGHRGYY